MLGRKAYITLEKFVFIKDIVKGHLIFRPIAWEEEKTESEA